MIETITSKVNPKIKYACLLKTSKGRNEHKQFLAEGFKTLEMALEAGVVCEVFSLEKIKLPKNVKQYIVSGDVLKKLSSTVNPEGVVFICNFLPIKEDLGKRIVYLDGVSDPGNMGTIIRTALALGYDAICYSQGSVSPYNEKVVASSKGAIFKIPVREIELCILKLKYQIIVSNLSDDSIPLKEVNTQDNFVLVLGNESHGVKKETVELSDINVKIPISTMESLNVAIAGGILMYSLNQKIKNK